MDYKQIYTRDELTEVLRGNWSPVVNVNWGIDTVQGLTIENGLGKVLLRIRPTSNYLIKTINVEVPVMPKITTKWCLSGTIGYIVHIAICEYFEFYHNAIARHTDLRTEFGESNCFLRVEKITYDEYGDEISGE